MVLSFLYLAFTRILQLVRLNRRGKSELAIEVVILRHEVAVLRRQVVRPALQPSDRALFAGLARLLDRRRRGRFFVQPETFLRWHRDLVGRKWTLCPPLRATKHSRRHEVDRPPAGPGEPHLGLPQNPGRAGNDGRRSCSLERLGHPASPRHRPVADSQGADLGRVPLYLGFIDVGL